MKDIPYLNFIYEIGVTDLELLGRLGEELFGRFVSSSSPLSFVLLQAS